MLTISNPLSARQARLHHAEEFRNARENYYSQGEEIRGTWHGRLAQTWGLTGEVEETAFARLAKGLIPLPTIHRPLSARQMATNSLATRASRCSRHPSRLAQHEGKHTVRRA
jgi:hypothetical protein